MWTHPGKARGLDHVQLCSVGGVVAAQQHAAAVRAGAAVQRADVDVAGQLVSEDLGVQKREREKDVDQSDTRNEGAALRSALFSPFLLLFLSFPFPYLYRDGGVVRVAVA